MMPNIHTNGVILCWIVHSFPRSSHVKNTLPKIVNNNVTDFRRELERILKDIRLPTQTINAIDKVMEINNSRFSALIFFAILRNTLSKARKNSQINTAINAAVILQKIDIRAMLGRK